MSEQKKETNKDTPKDRGPKTAVNTLYKSRQMLITGRIDDKVANTATTQLLAFAEESDEPINLFISSPGGHVESGDMIHDTIKFIKPVVRTIGSGWVASAGALIYVGAKRENRYCYPNTRFMLHQPSGIVRGMATNIDIQARQIDMMRERFDRLFAEATGQTQERINADTQRDFWLTPDEAVDYGLVGQVITDPEMLPKTKPVEG